jgi:D-alanyl-D-alanine carboxypeptidase
VKWKQKSLAALLTAASLALCILPAQALNVPSSFLALSKESTLNNPGIIVIDSNTHEVVFDHNPDVTRAPASVLKLVSTTSALREFGPDKVFGTTVSSTDKPNKFLLVGEGDPWLTTSELEATKYKRAYLPALINKVLELHPHLRAISLQYKNIYYQDIQAIERFYKGRVKIYPHAVSDTSDAQETLAKIESPPLHSIIEFTLLWSDNLLAARMSLMAAKAQGFSANAEGLQASFEKLFTELEIPAPGLVIVDGAGLSHKTRISSRTIADLLLKIKSEPSLQAIYDGLPLAGVTGTLKNRFTKDAPTAVGLIKAKTGWINTTVSLAGFVNSGEKEYVFAVIADRLPNREVARQNARITIDKMLATIAKPAPGAPPVTPAPDTSSAPSND